MRPKADVLVAVIDFRFSPLADTSYGFARLAEGELLTGAYGIGSIS